VDPLSSEYASNSVYAFSENEVIAFVELEGLEKGQRTSNNRPALTNRRPNNPRSTGTPDAVQYYRRQQYQFNRSQVKDIQDLQKCLFQSGLKVDLDEKLEPKVYGVSGPSQNNTNIQIFQIFTSTLDEGLKYVKKYGYGPGSESTSLGLTSEEVGITEGKCSNDNSVSMAKIHLLEYEYQQEFIKSFNEEYNRLVNEAGGQQECSGDQLTSYRERASCFAYNKVGWSSPMQTFKNVVEKLISQGALMKEGKETVETVPTINPGQ
jgi:hypothetical protein